MIIGGGCRIDVPGQHDELVRRERRDHQRHGRREDHGARDPGRARAQDDRRERAEVARHVDRTRGRAKRAEEAGASRGGGHGLAGGRRPLVAVAARERGGRDRRGVEDLVLGRHSGGGRPVAAAGLGTLGPLGAGHGSSSRCSAWGAARGRGRGGAA